jgi:5'-3' exonuclease
MTRRLLLDVSSMMYRAFFAMGSVSRTVDGDHSGAVHGYLDMVTTLIRKRMPHEVVHCYDHDWRPVERTKLYPSYKGHRPADPETLPPQFEMLHWVLDLTDMDQAQTHGWEAEDAIGAICRKADPDDRIEMVSGDRDLIQLVRDPAAKLLFTVRGVSDLSEFDEAGVMAKYGIPAERYCDFAILRGDPSDGLPGVAGIGEKTARALVLAYPSLEAVLRDAALDEPETDGPLRGKPALRRNLREASAYIAAMQQLVPVNPDAPLEIRRGKRDDDALRALADELGLRGPVTRLIAALDLLGVDGKE